MHNGVVSFGCHMCDPCTVWWLTLDVWSVYIQCSSSFCVCDLIQCSISVCGVKPSSYSISSMQVLLSTCSHLLCTSSQCRVIVPLLNPSFQIFGIVWKSEFFSHWHCFELHRFSRGCEGTSTENVLLELSTGLRVLHSGSIASAAVSATPRMLLAMHCWCPSSPWYDRRGLLGVKNQWSILFLSAWPEHQE